jgi:hypothetical protein
MTAAAASHPTDAQAAAARTARRMAALETLTEMGLRLAAAIDAQVEAFVASPPPENAREILNDLARAFHQVTRSVRLSVALEEQLDQDVDARRRAADRARAEAARDLVVQAVEAVIEADQALSSFESANARKRLERVIEREYADRETFLGRDVGALIVRLSLELGLDPDWDDWPDEAWAQNAKAADPRPPRETPKPGSRRAVVTRLEPRRSP